MTPTSASTVDPVAARVEITDVVVAVCGAGLAVLLLVLRPTSTGWPVGALLAGWMLIGTWISVIDVREHRIPNRLVAAMTATATMGLLAVGGFANGSVHLGRGGAWAVTATAVMLVVHISSNGAVGMGDVKLTFPLVLVLAAFGSSVTVWTAFCVAVVIAGVVVVARAVLGRDQGPLPAAPFLMAGAGIALLAV